MTESLEQTHGIDDESMEIAENPYISQDNKNSLLLSDLNLKVAVIAGWTDIKEWDGKAVKKTFVGTNKSHPELGIFVPNYIESLDAITKVFLCLKLNWGSSVGWDGLSYVKHYANGKDIGCSGKTPAIALCKLLIEIDPTPEKPKPKIAVIEAVFA